MSELLLPNEYQFMGEEFPNIEFELKNCEVYGLMSDSFEAIILKCIIPEQVSMNFDNPQIIIDDWHENMLDDCGIIEVNNGISKNGNKYVYSIVKFHLDSDDELPTGNGYSLNLNVMIDDDIYLISSNFKERGTTGVRDNIVYLVLRQKYPDMKHPFDGWSRDPYDPEFNKGFLMNISEESQFDVLFPDHPLTKVRNLVEYILDNN